MPDGNANDSTGPSLDLRRSVTTMLGLERFARRSSKSTLGSLLGLALLLWALVALRLWHVAHLGLPLDFHVYRDGALSMLRDQATYQRSFTHVHLNFTYPPFALLLVCVFAILPPYVGIVIWWLLSAAALVAIVAIAINALTNLSRAMTIMLSLALSAGACLFLEPVRSGLNFGQINLFLMLLVLVDLLCIRSSSRGVLTGLAAAIKLTPLIYIAYFLISRARSSALRAVAAFVGATAVAWLMLPTDSTLFWLHQAFSPSRKGGTSTSVNQSLFGLVGHVLSGPPTAITLVWLVLSATIFLAGIMLAKRYVESFRPVDAVLALALTELLVSPISWTHHWSWIVLIPVMLLVRRNQSFLTSAAMMLLTTVAIAEPYRWHPTDWYSHGIAMTIVSFSLLICGAALLLVMGTSELYGRRNGAIATASLQLNS